MTRVGLQRHGGGGGGIESMQQSFYTPTTHLQFEFHYRSQKDRIPLQNVLVLNQQNAAYVWHKLHFLNLPLAVFPTFLQSG
jgi:hypothetical protein